MKSLACISNQHQGCNSEKYDRGVILSYHILLHTAKYAINRFAAMFNREYDQAKAVRVAGHFAESCRGF